MPLLNSSRTISFVPVIMNGFGRGELDPVGRRVRVRRVVGVDAERLAEPGPVDQLVEADQALVVCTSVSPVKHGLDAVIRPVSG